ncbi:unnamed protein product, partial [Iphiclides podalirius]
MSKPCKFRNRKNKNIPTSRTDPYCTPVRSTAQVGRVSRAVNGGVRVLRNAGPNCGRGRAASVGISSGAFRTRHGRTRKPKPSGRSAGDTPRLAENDALHVSQPRGPRNLSTRSSQTGWLFAC